MSGIERLRGASGADFLRAAAREGLVTDLSLGGWRPRQAATELALQLDIALAPRGAVEAPRGYEAGLERAAVVGEGVDAEARGKAPARLAFEDACLIAEKVERGEPIAFVSPLAGLPAREQDVLLVQFLSRLSDARLAWIELELGADDPGVWGLYPGLAPGGAGIGALACRGGGWVIDPALRQDPRHAPKSRVAQVPALAPDDQWLNGYAMMFGHNLFADSNFLLALAEAAFASGAAELALDYAARASACAKHSANAALAQARAQGFRISAHRFDEAAAAPAVNRSAPEELRDYIDDMRAWGQVMSGRHEEARARLEATVERIESAGSMDGYDLYLMNIVALRRLRSGDEAGALKLERDIEAANSGPERDARLAYVNLLNLSRLAKRRGEHDEAECLHRAAFATSLGVLSPWEAFHQEVLDAQSAEALGRNAEQSWARASLLWVSHPCPESLPDRAARALLGPRLPEDVAKAIDGALSGKLGEACSSQPALRFAQALPDQTCKVVIARDWAVCAIAVHGRSGVERPSAAPLCQALAERLLLAGEVSVDELIVVDADNGYGLGCGLGDAHALARRWGAEVIVDGEGMEVAETSADSVSIRINPAIVSLVEREAIVAFARHETVRRVSAPVLKLLQKLQRGPAPLTAIDARATTALNQALSLERKRLIRVEWAAR